MKQNETKQFIKQQIQLNEQISAESFTKGMTLDEYLKSRNQQIILNDQQKKKQNSMMEELQVEPIQNSKGRHHNYQIKQTDQDNYQQSRDISKQGQQLFENGRDLVVSKSKDSNMNQKINLQQRNSIIILKPLQDRRSSVGPIHKNDNKIETMDNDNSQGKMETKQKPLDMFRSLYGTKLKQSNKMQDQMLHSTFYLKPVLSKKNKKDDKYFHLKNKQQYNEVLNYENMRETKYDARKENPVVNIRIQGIRDKYVERKKTTSTNKY